MTDVFVKAPTSVGDPAAVAAFQPDLPAIDGPFECSKPRQLTANEIAMVGLPANSVALMGFFPTAADVQATVALTLDSAGKLLRYAERRGPALRAERRADMTPAQVASSLKTATDANRSTMISLDTRRNQAVLTNRGGGAPFQSVIARMDAVASLEKFGKPLDRARRVIAACRTPG